MKTKLCEQETAEYGASAARKSNYISVGILPNGKLACFGRVSRQLSPRLSPNLYSRIVISDNTVPVVYGCVTIIQLYAINNVVCHEVIYWCQGNLTTITFLDHVLNEQQIFALER